jgi:hypothetical protein
LYRDSTISMIYAEIGLSNLAISLLTFLVKHSYSMRTLRRVERKAFAPSVGSLRDLLLAFNAEFTPDPASITTALVGSYLADLLMRNKMFNAAEELIENISNAMRNNQFLRIKLLLKRNMFRDFLASVPQIDCRKIRMSTMKQSIDAGVAFDSTAAIMKLLGKSSLDRCLFEDLIFWAEVIIQANGRSSLRETGIAHLIRGTAFAEVFLRMHTFVNGNSLTRLLTPMKAELAA